MKQITEKRRALIESVQSGGLPPGVRKCLCIGPTVRAGTTEETRYINTGIVVDPDHTSLIIDFETIDNNNGAIIASSYQKGYSPAAADSLGWYGNYGGRPGYGLTDLGYKEALMPNNNIRTVMEYNWKEKFIHNHTNGNSLSLSDYTYEPYGDYPLCVFLRPYAAYGTSLQGWLYHLYIYYDSELVLEYIPCVDASNNACVFDTVQKALVYPVGNANTPYGFVLE